MPFVRVTLAGPSPSEATVAALQAGVTALMAEKLAKRADLTAVLVEGVAPGGWSVGAAPVTVAAHLDAKVTAGSNSPAQKADFHRGGAPLARRDARGCPAPRDLRGGGRGAGGILGLCRIDPGATRSGSGLTASRRTRGPATSRNNQRAVAFS
jgi:phenylpyruvate tautomerase PptA (4-oxalocrotonate tautomerase family)